MTFERGQILAIKVANVARVPRQDNLIGMFGPFVADAGGLNRKRQIAKLTEKFLFRILLVLGTVYFVDFQRVFRRKEVAAPEVAHVPDIGDGRLVHHVGVPMKGARIKKLTLAVVADDVTS